MNIHGTPLVLFFGSLLYYFVLHEPTKKLYTIIYIKLRTFRRPLKVNKKLKKNDDDDDVYSDDESVPPSII